MYKQYFLYLVAIALSAIHHADHIIRGTNVGWPVTSEVNAFTYSLVIYPLIALRFFLPSSVYGLVLATGGVLLLTAIHFGPFALEPPQDIIAPYANPLVGYAALGALIGLVLTLLLIIAVHSRDLLHSDSTEEA